MQCDRDSNNANRLILNVKTGYKKEQTLKKTSRIRVKAQGTVECQLPIVKDYVMAPQAIVTWVA